MTAALLLLSIILTGNLKTTFIMKEYTKRSERGIFLFNALSQLFGAVFFIAISLKEFVFSADYLIYSVCFAILYLCSDVFYILSVATGSLFLSSLLLSYSLVLPAGYGIIFLGEPITLTMIIALALLAVSVFLTNFEKRGENKKITPKWILFITLAFLSTGLLSVIQKMQQIKFDGAYKNEFMTVALLISSMISFIIAFITQRDTIKKNLKIALPLSIASGVSNGAMNLMVMILTATMAASIMFPSITAGGIVFSFLVALLIYKEKQSIMQCAGAVVGIAAIILFNI